MTRVPNDEFPYIPDSLRILKELEIGHGFTRRIDEPDQDTTYIGVTNAEDPDVGEPHWYIQRITTDGTETIFESVNGQARFDQVWSDRTTLTYK